MKKDKGKKTLMKMFCNFAIKLAAIRTESKQKTEEKSFNESKRCSHFHFKCNKTSPSGTTIKTVDLV